MNLLDLQDQLKGLSEQQLVAQMQSPDGAVPQYLVLSEITRRKRMRDDLAARQSQNMPTVAEQAVAAAGVPQGGIGDMARAMAPQSAIAQNTGVGEMPVQGMYGGGYVQKMAVGGGPLSPAMMAWLEAEADRRNMTVDQVMADLGPTGTRLMETEAQRASRDRMLGFEPSGMGITTPTQEDLDQRFAESQGRQPSFPDSGFSEPSRIPLPMTNGRPLYETLAAKTGTLLPTDQVDLDLTVPDMSGVFTQSGDEAGFDPFFPPAQPEAPLDYGSMSDNRLRAELGAAGNPFTEGATDAAEAITGLIRRSGGYLNERGADLAATLGFTGLAETMYDTSDKMDELTAQRAEDEAAREADVAARKAEIEAIMRERGIPIDNPTAPPVVSPPAVAQPATENTPRPKARPPAGGTNEDVRTGVGDGAVVSGAALVGGGGSGGAGSTAGTGTPAAGGSSYEQELIDAMRRAEKRAKQDKWLALAQVGLGMMNSTKNPLGALGEAGMGGLEAFRSARDTYENERLGISKSLYELQQQRMAQAMAAQRAAGAAASRRALTPLEQVEQLKKFRDSLYATSTNDLGEEITTPLDQTTIDQINEEIRRITAYATAPQM